MKRQQPARPAAKQAPKQAAAKVTVMQAAGHFAMGATLGTAGALVAMVGDTSAIHHWMAGSGPSGLPITVFVGASACTIAIGATLTGLIFQAIDQR